MPNLTLTAVLTLSSVEFHAATGVNIRYSFVIGGATINRSFMTTFPPSLRQAVAARATELAIANAKTT
jgi:hypothetical protein